MTDPFAGPLSGPGAGSPPESSARGPAPYGPPGGSSEWGPEAVPPAYPPLPPPHPQAQTVFVFGLLGMLLCQVLAPVAWVQGTTVVREIDAAQGALGGRDNANAGRVMGIVGTVLLGITLLFLGVAFVGPLLYLGVVGLVRGSG